MSSSKTITAKELLKAFLLNVYGQTTFSIRKLGCSDLFNTLNDRILYFDRRINIANGLVINETTCLRYLELTKRALDGRLNSIEAISFSSRLAKTVSLYSGIAQDVLEFHYSDSETARSQKRNALLEVTKSMLQLYIGKQSVSSDLIHQAAKEAYLLSTSSVRIGTNATAYGVEHFYFNVNETQYPLKLEKVRTNLDIVHFHGLSWTNQNREFLLDALTRNTLTIRVVLLDPDSPFFVPYADFINVSEEYLKEKTEEVIAIWSSMLQTAQLARDDVADFTLMLAEGFPAKSMYRFDDSVIVTPTTNAKPKAQFMAYECVDIKDNPKNAFQIYLSEINWLCGAGKVILANS